MLKAIVLCLATVCAITLAAAPASATKRCPPIPVHLTGGPASCKCGVQNYGTTIDFGVKVTMYEATGEIAQCQFDFPPKHGDFCYVGITAGNQCGCVVTGEGATTVVSLSVVDPATAAAQATVECK